MKGFLSEDRPIRTLREITTRLQEAYCNTVGYEVSLLLPHLHPSASLVLNLVQDTLCVRPRCCNCGVWGGLGSCEVQQITAACLLLWALHWSDYCSCVRWSAACRPAVTL